MNGTGIVSAGTAGDRSLGVTTDPQLGIGAGNRTNSVGVRFVNSTSVSISDVSVSFDGEQWTRGANSPQIDYSLFFSHQIFPAGQGNISVSTGWIAVPELTFTSPNDTLTTAATLDGNAADNSIPDIRAFISGTDLAPGEEIWLRWSTKNPAYPKSCHTLTIDNLTVAFTAVPEPSSFGTFAGLAGLAAVARRRRRS